MKSSYTAQSDTFYRTITTDTMCIGFKEVGAQTKFMNCSIEMVFSSKSYNGLDDAHNLMIGPVPMMEYIGRLNSLILISASDTESQEKFQVLNGEIMTMTGDVPTPAYLGYVLYKVISKWSSENGFDLVDLTIKEV